MSSVVFGLGTRRSAASTAYTVLDRADGATDVRESASRSVGAVAHESHPEPSGMSLNNSFSSSAKPTLQKTRKPFESSAITG